MWGTLGCAGSSVRSSTPAYGCHLSCGSETRRFLEQLEKSPHEKARPRSPLQSPRKLRDPELDRANASLIATLQGTRRRPFGLRDGQHNPLFAVQPGVNAEDALMHVSLLLKCAEEVSDEITERASGVERGLIWSMVHSVEMARAVVDALLDGTRPTS